MGCRVVQLVANPQILKRIEIRRCDLRPDHSRRPQRRWPTPTESVGKRYPYLLQRIIRATRAVTDCNIALVPAINARFASKVRLHLCQKDDKA